MRSNLNIREPSNKNLNLKILIKKKPTKQFHVIHSYLNLNINYFDFIFVLLWCCFIEQLMQASLDGKSNRAASFTDSKMFDQQVKSKRSSSINHSSKYDKNLTVYSPPRSFLSISNKIFNDLSQAIQLVQKSFLEKESKDEKLTNSDYQVHELCQQFDYVFLLGLKNREEGYWKVVVEFTHRDVLKELKKLLNVNTSIGRGRAWIYHALNENLMESYLRCFLDNKKLVSKFYTPGISLVSDEQVT